MFEIRIIIIYDTRTRRTSAILHLRLALVIQRREHDIRKIGQYRRNLRCQKPPLKIRIHIIRPENHSPRRNATYIIIYIRGQIQLFEFQYLAVLLELQRRSHFHCAIYIVGRIACHTSRKPKFQLVDAVGHNVSSTQVGVVDIKVKIIFTDT